MTAPSSLPWNIIANPSAETLADLDSRCFHPCWDHSTYRGLLTQPAVSACLLLIQDRPAGFVCSQRVEDEAELYRIGIVPQRRGEGWGARLLRHWLEDQHAKGVRRVFLEVRAGNLAAARLYGAADFVRTGRRPGYYQHPTEDAWVFTYHFDPPKPT